jgi:peptide/nickel transport system permease protein
MLHGARISLGIAVATTAGTAVLGLGLGLLAATSNRFLGSAVMRVVDIVQALPGLLLALALVGVLGPSLRNLVVAIVAVWWAGYARVVRSVALSVRERPFVEAARALGASEWRILRRHVLPNVLGPTAVLSTLDLGRTLLAVSGLSFLGLGARPPSPEWGAMLAEARHFLDRAPLPLLYPGLAITVFALACNLLGDGLRDALDPRARRSVAPQER